MQIEEGDGEDLQLMYIIVELYTLFYSKLLLVN